MKNMKKNKGFTLVELLAVIVILLSISIIAVPNIKASMNKRYMKDIQDDKDTMLRYVEIYRSSNQNFDSCLKNEGYIILRTLAEKKNIKLKNASKFGTSTESGAYIYYVDGVMTSVSDLIGEYEYNITEHTNCIQYVE